mmetsp:Transcript_153338/g.268027  ORF Transcript_153338/g.268027 Transcript_153338/m.268027 type:complete len:251 (+) Transcript_153338:1235-1987(+)
MGQKAALLGHLVLQHLLCAGLCGHQRPLPQEDPAAGDDRLDHDGVHKQRQQHQCHPLLLQWCRDGGCHREGGADKAVEHSQSIANVNHAERESGVQQLPGEGGVLHRVEGPDLRRRAVLEVVPHRALDVHERAIQNCQVGAIDSGDPKRRCLETDVRNAEADRVADCDKGPTVELRSCDCHTLAHRPKGHVCEVGGDRERRVAAVQEHDFAAVADFRRLQGGLHAPEGVQAGPVAIAPTLDGSDGPVPDE